MSAAPDSLRRDLREVHKLSKRLRPLTGQAIMAYTMAVDDARVTLCLSWRKDRCT